MTRPAPAAVGVVVRVLVLVLVLVLGLAGCVVPAARQGGGGSGSTTRPPLSPIATTQARHQYPSPPAPRERVTGAYSTPSAAVAAFAGGYINWTAATVAADMTALAARSIGQARAVTQLAAGQTASDYELRRDGIANIGVVEAIAPLQHAPGRYVVVTREQTTATGTLAYQGLQPAWHVAVATVTQVGPGEWVVSGWEPQG